MRILRLHLSQYRNYRSLDLDLGREDLQVFLGDNASGKTNVLEAIALLSTLQSFRGEEEDLRLWGTDFYRIRADVEQDNGERSLLEVTSQVLPRKQKACFRNDVRMQANAMVGLLPTVTFLPQDLELFSGAPSGRRRFLDALLSQTSFEYYRSLLEYQRLLKQRNALLKRVAEHQAKPTELDPWDEKVAEEGSLLTISRLELAETFGLALREELRALGESGWKDISIRYERSGSERTSEPLTRELRSSLAHYRERDILLQTTSIGPHRDDWFIEADGRNVLSFASRGQQRVCVLALLLLEASFLDIRRGERPVILLDDIFSELDREHQVQVLRSLSNHQVLCTTTHLPISAQIMKLWKVRDGFVTE